MIAAQSIQSGANNIVVSGGMESMSNAPKYIPRLNCLGPTSSFSFINCYHLPATIQETN